jgi:hypothetical protein
MRSRVPASKSAAYVYMRPKVSETYLVGNRIPPMNAFVKHHAEIFMHVLHRSPEVESIRHDEALTQEI